MSKWFNNNSKFNDVVISSSISIFRNLKGYNFFKTMDMSEAIEVKYILKKAIENLNIENLNYHDMYNTKKNEGLKLLEDSFTNGKIINSMEKSAFFVDTDKKTNILINNDEHLQVKLINNGYSVREDYTKLLDMENELEENIDFAYDYKYGYLTSDFKKVGTGLNISIVMQLSALVETGKINEIIESMEEEGIQVKPLYRKHGYQDIGAIYVFSNKRTLGFSENYLVDKMEEVVYKIVTREREARKTILLDDKNYVEDTAYRAYGVLKYSRNIEFNEAVDLLSDITLGVTTGIFEEISLEELRKLMISIQSSNIIYNQKTDEDLDEYKIRANMIRNFLSNLKLIKEG